MLQRYRNIWFCEVLGGSCLYFSLYPGHLCRLAIHDREDLVPAPVSALHPERLRLPTLAFLTPQRTQPFEYPPNQARSRILLSVRRRLCICSNQPSPHRIPPPPHHLLHNPRLSSSRTRPDLSTNALRTPKPFDYDFTSSRQTYACAPQYRAFLSAATVSYPSTCSARSGGNLSGCEGGRGEVRWRGVVDGF